MIAPAPQPEPSDPVVVPPPAAALPPVVGPPLGAAAPPQPLKAVEPPLPAVVIMDDAPTARDALSSAPVTEDALPATEPLAPGDVRVTRLPRSLLEGVRERLGKLAQHARKVLRAIPTATPGRPPWLLPAMGLGGALVGVTGVALSVSMKHRASSPPQSPDLGASASASASAQQAAHENAATLPTPTALAPEPAPAPQPPPPPPASTTPCTVAGPARVLAPKALVAAGVELRAIGSDVAVGFAPNERDGVALRISPDSVTALNTTTVRSANTVRRVTPFMTNKGALGAWLDWDRKNDTIQGRRTAGGDPPLQFGSADGGLVWAKTGAASGTRLWALDGDADVDALRASSDGTGSERTTAIAFRRGNTIGLGLASGEDSLRPAGDLLTFAGLGPAVGSPAVAIGGGVVIVAWADRVSGEDPWRLRWVRVKQGEAVRPPMAFSPPAGGKGEQAMSPSLTGLDGRRFLLVWTEGPQARHDVRALTLSDEGRALGPPLEISTEGKNAGQGQAAVTASGHGAVAFLESTETGFEMAVTPVTCL